MKPKKVNLVEVEEGTSKESGRGRIRKSDSSRVRQALEAIALCHNVTPCTEQNPDGDHLPGEQHSEEEDENSITYESKTEADRFYENANEYTYQVRNLKTKDLKDELDVLSNFYPGL